jgi:NAD(P)-dependent dehydrogenase (short-subunit alcohol dehydrogenase family)
VNSEDFEMANRFPGKTALVAGGTGGLGRAVTLAFLNEGAKVFVTYRSEKEFSALKGAAGADTSSLNGLQVDITNPSEVTGLVEKVGGLDILVNTVGAYSGGTTLWETDPETFERMMSLNVRSGFVLARSFVPVMLRQGSGSIVNISSRSAVDHAAGAGAYSASKAAAVAMMDSLAADLKGTGIRVNTVLPSIIDTEANRNAMPGANYANWPKPEQIADVILFLCDNASKLIHGAAVPVYGVS